jgi:hypothetical protein
MQPHGQVDRYGTFTNAPFAGQYDNLVLDPAESRGQTTAIFKLLLALSQFFTGCRAAAG